jgi:hypothetical protein
MRHEHHAGPLRGHGADGGEDAADLGVAERRRRFVEDQDACVAAEQPRDLDQLPLAQ